MSLKKKKKEPNSTMSNLNMLIIKNNGAYSQNRIKNIFAALKVQLEESEFEKLREMYDATGIANPDSFDDMSNAYAEFIKYVKALNRKYAKK